MSLLTAEDCALLYRNGLYRDNRIGLIAHYPLARRWSGGVNMYDASGRLNNGIITPGASAGFMADQYGRAGMAYDFDGANTTIPTLLTSNTDFQNGFTISAWINPDSYGESTTYGGCVLNKAADGYGNSGFNYHLTNNNNISFRITSGVERASANNSITYGKWQYILITVASNATVTHYIDGIQSGTPGQVNSLSGITTNNPLTIGNGPDLVTSFNGRISDLRVYNRVISLTEISYLFDRNGALYKRAA